MAKRAAASKKDDIKSESPIHIEPLTSTGKESSAHIYQLPTAIEGNGEVELTMSRDPVAVLEEAHRAAKALKDVISKKSNPVIMNGQQYLEFEDWQTCGRFFGITAKVVSTNPVQMGNVMGFEAIAAAYNVKSGQEISRAEAMCLNDEEKWRARPKYKSIYILKGGRKFEGENPPKDELHWIPNPNKLGKMMPQRERTLIGEEAVPLFQLRSMAQTRACSKALRNCLAWVVVLAGYKPTPAEEMDGLSEFDQRPEREQQQAAEQKTTQQTTTQRQTQAKTYTETQAHRDLKTAIKDYIVTNEMGDVTNEEAEKTILLSITSWEPYKRKDGSQAQGCAGFDRYDLISEKMALAAIRNFNDTISGKRKKK